MKPNVSSIILFAACQFLKVTDLIDTRVKFSRKVVKYVPCCLTLGTNGLQALTSLLQIQV